MTPVMTILIFIVALTLCVGVLLVVFTLVPALNQLRCTLADMEKTSGEIRDLAKRVKFLTERVDADLGHVEAVLEASRETVEVVSTSMKMINKNVLAKSAGLMAFIPAIRFGWNLVRKLKGRKHE